MHVSISGGSRDSAAAWRHADGFTLIEVLVAILVLAVGLLGFALLQTLSVRMSQSSNYRTQATNLATELLDQMRSNRLSAANYPGQASFASNSMTSAACEPETGTQDVAAMAALWKCQVVRALGEGASATVSYNGGVATVTLRWPERTGADTAFSVSTLL